MYLCYFINVLLLLFGFVLFASSEEVVVDSSVPPTKSPESETVTASDEKLEYAKGSVCRYCRYCQFCKLCDQDCPCERSAHKPNCHMCKYCNYCYLCSALCDTICKPGGIVDSVSSAILSKLPEFNKAEVESDIGSVADWTRDEL